MMKRVSDAAIHRHCTGNIPARTASPARDAAMIDAASVEAKKRPETYCCVSFLLLDLLVDAQRRLFDEANVVDQDLFRKIIG